MRNLQEQVKSAVTKTYTENVSLIKVHGIPVLQNVPCNMHINIMGIACIPPIPVISQFR